MLILKQNSHDIGNLATLLNKYGNTNISMNRDIISDDIQKLERGLIRAENKSDLNNMKGIMNYLSKLSKKIDENGNYQMVWQFANWKIYSYPMGLRHFPEYNIKASDYIVIGKQSLIRIDYREAFRLIAFEITHRDFGVESEDIEEGLKDVGLLTISNIDLIQRYYNEEDPLKMSKVFRIGDSQYASKNGNLSYDYFGTALDDGEPFTSGYYRDCVGRSIDVAICIIVKQLIDAFVNNGIYFQICSLSEDGLYFLVENQQTKNVQDCIENIVVRAFGRRFEIQPGVEIF